MKATFFISVKPTNKNILSVYERIKKTLKSLNRNAIELKVSKVVYVKVENSDTSDGCPIVVEFYPATAVELQVENLTLNTLETVVTKTCEAFGLNEGVTVFLANAGEAYHYEAFSDRDAHGAGNDFSLAAQQKCKDNRKKGVTSLSAFFFSRGSGARVFGGYSNLENSEREKFAKECSFYNFKWKKSHIIEF